MRVLLRENQFSKLIKFISESSTQLKKVIFVGDSLSEGPNTWNYLLSQSHPEWETEHIAERGKNTTWMLRNLESKLRNSKYDFVFIYGGTNDMFENKGTSVPINNIQRMVDLINKNGAKAYVLQGFDAETIMSPNKMKGNRYCNKDCMKRGRENTINLQNQLSSIRNAVIIPKIVGDSSWTIDGTHPKGSKHEVVKNMVEKYLDNTPNTSFSTSERSLKNKPKTIELLSKFFQILGFSNPEWGISTTHTPEFEQAIKNFKFDQGLELTTDFGEEDLSLLKDLLIRNNFKVSDLQDVNLQKNKSVSKIGNQNISIDNPEVKGIDSSVNSKFESVVGDNYSDFISKVQSIGLNPEIAIKQLYAESGFNKDVISCKRKSSAGAQGIAQFMPGTWKSYGVGSPCEVSNALNAYVKMMNDLLKMFPNRPDLAIAGYNSGPFGKYGKIYKDALNNNIPFEKLKGKIPKETFNYVSKIFGK